MILIPYETVSYTTNLSKEAVRERLAEVVRPTMSFSFSFWKDPGGKEYRGEVNEDGFEIVRIIRGRNSFIPVISGDISEQVGGCTIAVSMRLHFFVMVFIVFWCGIVGMGAVSALVSSHGNAVVPICMLLFMYFMTIIGFNIEKNRSIKDLQRILDAEVINE